MSCPKHADILQAITDRKVWEGRQATWYQMRHDGLRRANKPWANAADMHFPLADMIIEKLKPYYVGQVFATDTVASFVSLKETHLAQQSAAALWFDSKLKQKSNFEDEMCIAPDIMLQTGLCPMKVYWDATKQRIAFEAINPLYLLVPSWTGRLPDADWITHVQTYSETAYRALKGFKTDAETIAKLTSDYTEGAGQYEQQKHQREGITKPTTKGQIIIWEVYYRDENKKWRVKTYSPQCDSIELRPEFGLPYNKGVFADDVPPPPFALFVNEVKDRGYYSPRGVCERVATFEASLCKDWNTMKDYQTLTCSPMFSAESGVPTNANIRMIPGQIMPFKLAAVTFPSMPVDIAQSMMGTRQTAEQLMAVPDVGTGRSVDPGKNKTAAETNLIASIMGQSADARSRVFRGDLGWTLTLAWGIAIQYMDKDANYFFREELLKVDPAAFSGEYRIEPNGSGDNVNRGLVIQRAISRMQMFAGKPNINQDELTKSVLEADDPRLVKRLFLNAGTQSAEQQEDQASEISIMLLGFPAQVKESDDDLSHINSCGGFMQRREQTGEPVTPEFLTLMKGHVEAHAIALKKKNPQAAEQAKQQVQGLLAGIAQKMARVTQQIQQLQAQQQAAQGARGNVIPMPPQAQPQPQPQALPAPGPAPLGQVLGGVPQ